MERKGGRQRLRDAEVKGEIEREREREIKEKKHFRIFYSPVKKSTSSGIGLL